MNILVVDDDRNICELVRLYLEKEGFGVEVALDGVEAMHAFGRVKPALVLLDIMLPEKDGLQVCREIRQAGNTPVIMLTAKGETFDKVLGLELGADDYMVKPIEPKELVARVKAVLRRAQSEPASGDSGKKELVFDRLSVNPNTYDVLVDGKKVEMPPKEFELLFFLASNPNRVYTRNQLLDEIWGYEFFGDSRTVDVHVKRIREKIELEGSGWQLKTVWGVGYKFEA